MKIKLSYTLILFSVIYCTSNSYAQLSDSTWYENKDSSNIIYFYPNNPFALNDTFVLDTSLYYFQRYDARTADYDATASTMTTGGPTKNLYFTEFLPQFTVGDQYLFPYFYDVKRLPIYSHVKVPYSELTYTMASQEENYLKGVVASQISQRLYFGIDFNIQSTVGLFTNQRVSNTHARGVVGFETFNKRYGYDAEYIYNKFKFGENGGLSQDTYYQDSTQYPRQVLAVNLDDATNSIKSHYFAFNQHLNIGKPSTDSTKHKFIGKIYLNSLYQRKYRNYEDALWDSSYYQNAYLDSLESFDSTSITDFSADFGISNFYPERHQYFTFDFGAKYSYKTYYDGNEGYFFNYFAPHGNVIFDFYKVLLEGGLKYQIQIPTTKDFTYGANDFNLYGKLKFPLLQFLDLDFGIKMDLQSPQINSYKTYSNHFMWNNDFNKQKHIELNGHIDYKGYELDAAIHTINDFVYFDENVNPQQFTGSFQIITTRFKKRFKIKRLGSTMMILYQQSSNENVIRMPKLVGRASFYYAIPLFKRALIVHPGIDLTYLSSYYGEAYNPAMMQFHTQNSKKLAEQIYADVYVNFKIKRARIFIKYQNVGSHLGTYNYFLVPHYPQQDAVLKFGFSWKFYD